MIIIHISIATASLIATGIAFLRPSNSKLQISYVLIALTIITGSYLILTTHTNLTQTCTSGLVYLGIVTCGIMLARRKLKSIVN